MEKAMHVRARLFANVVPFLVFIGSRNTLVEPLLGKLSLKKKKMILGRYFLLWKYHGPKLETSKQSGVCAGWEGLFLKIV